MNAPPQPDASIRPIIGLEVHVQLATRTKLFCGCPVEFAAPPNSRVCAVCMGLPGSLPVLNRAAIELAVRAGLALNCRIARLSRWDRKSYYYPDLPKNYQISQYDQPVCGEGFFDVPTAAGSQRVRIRRAHLEEDAGKNIHDTPGCTLVDLNRAGTPLLEIVTEPDLLSAEATYAFAVELQRLVTYLGVGEGNMQKGQMRFEPNINVAIVADGAEYRTPISEVKNLNSFRSLRLAIEYEIARQVSDWQADRGYLQRHRPNENRGWNDARGTTELQRRKEQADDYRYFPDPDLLPVELEDAFISRLKIAMPELPLVRRQRFVEQLRLSQEEAEIIVGDRATADLFESAAEAGPGTPPALLGKQFVNLWAPLANERQTTIPGLPIEAGRIGQLGALVHNGTVSSTAAKQIAERMLTSRSSPAELAKEMSLVRVGDESQVQQWIDQAIAANPQAVQTILSNPKKAAASEGFLRGQVMRLSGGQADPKLVSELLARRVRRES